MGRCLSTECNGAGRQAVAYPGGIPEVSRPPGRVCSKEFAFSMYTEVSNDSAGRQAGVSVQNAMAPAVRPGRIPEVSRRYPGGIPEVSRRYPGRQAGSVVKNLP